MNPLLRAFVERHCVHSPIATYAVKAFVDDFRNRLPPKMRAAWTRGRVVAELSASGFVIGTREKIQVVAGLGQPGVWREVNGRLELTR